MLMYPMFSDLPRQASMASTNDDPLSSCSIFIYSSRLAACTGSSKVPNSPTLGGNVPSEDNFDPTSGPQTIPGGPVGADTDNLQRSRALMDPGVKKIP